MKIFYGVGYLFGTGTEGAKAGLSGDKIFILVRCYRQW
jgi:hypothetical protein